MYSQCKSHLNKYLTSPTNCINILFNQVIIQYLIVATRKVELWLWKQLWRARKNSKHIRKARKNMAGRPPFDQFNAESEDMESYLEQLQEYFNAYDIDQDDAAKHLVILFTSIGTPTLQT